MSALNMILISRYDVKMLHEIVKTIDLSMPPNEKSGDHQIH